jgi:hypothetical protein
MTAVPVIMAGWRLSSSSEPDTDVKLRGRWKEGWLLGSGGKRGAIGIELMLMRRMLLSRCDCLHPVVFARLHHFNNGSGLAAARPYPCLAFSRTVKSSCATTGRRTDSYNYTTARFDYPDALARTRRRRDPCRAGTK